MKLALAFSGGKDSWACLWLQIEKQRIHEVDVIYVNTGKAYPETLALVEKAKTLCPSFHEVVTSQYGQNRREGIPSDIVPVDHTSFGMQFTGNKDVKVQPYLQCCYENISRPLHDKALALGCTHLIRGQRMKDAHKSPARNFMPVEGLTYLHPIEDWSDKDVMDLLKKHMDIPDHFTIKHSSLDCYDCTAFSEHSQDRIEWMRTKHPELAKDYDERRNALVSAINPIYGRLSHG